MELRINGQDKLLTDVAANAAAIATNTTNIGDLAYTENNYITDSEPLTESVDKLDMAVNDNAAQISHLEADVADANIRVLEAVDTVFENEKGNFLQFIIDELQGLPVFGIVDENNTITITSQLSDGTYTLKYELEDETTQNVGSIIIGVPTPPYINLSDTTSEYWKQGYRISSSMQYAASEYNTCTNWIPFIEGDIIRVEGMRIAVSGANQGGELISGENGVGYVRFATSINGTTPSVAIQFSTLYQNAITVVDGIEIIDTSLLNYVETPTHFCLVGILEGSPEDVIITVNEEIIL